MKVNCLSYKFDEHFPTSNSMSEKREICEESFALDCDRMSEDREFSASSSDSIQDLVPDRREIILSKEELDCVSEKIVEDHPSMAASDKIKDQVPDTPQSMSCKEEHNRVSEKIVKDPDPSLASTVRTDDPVIDKVEFSSSNEPDCISPEIIEDPNPRMAPRDGIEESEHLPVPDMLESTLAAASQTVSEIFPLIFINLTFLERKNPAFKNK